VNVNHRLVGGSGEAQIAGEQADDPAILFLEWLTNTAIANQHRIGGIWAPIHYHFMQLLQVNAAETCGVGLGCFVYDEYAYENLHECVSTIYDTDER
jgi:hypothetical protein